MFVISKTHVGMVRTVNEDALLTTGPELLRWLTVWAAMQPEKPPAGKPYRFAAGSGKI